MNFKAPDETTIIRYVFTATISSVAVSLIDFDTIAKATIDDLGQATAAQLNSYALIRIMDYKTNPSTYSDLNFLYAFKENFEQWTTSEFKALDSCICRELYLAYDAQFSILLTLKSLPPWDEYELQTADLHANTEANRQRKELSRLDQTRGSRKTIQASEGNDIDTKDPNTSIPSAPLIKAIGTSRITHTQSSNEDLDDPSSIDSKEYQEHKSLKWLLNRSQIQPSPK
ncbi:hypothetical protein GcM1_218022 [Golovinomyces cichoracearum]|uniref:Uncharacterized protein n=1 Tax=Golovinomyces cichoracearum TaxID=62708 RepID=A0A420ISM7_9PEZI|nr:hypothetical protein GcM1_218022 [Golovinomyces cichoracearum]